MTDAAAERLKDFITSHPMTVTYGSWLDWKADIYTLLSERSALREALASVIPTNVGLEAMPHEVDWQMAIYRPLGVWRQARALLDNACIPAETTAE
jgi:hypothetical protein